MMGVDGLLADSLSRTMPLEECPRFARAAEFADGRKWRSLAH
jgi:hypothetical protein